ncbi:MAG: thioredoxin domain-containing protein [bacterium]
MANLPTKTPPEDNLDIINLEPYLIPAAILFSGILISISVIFAFSHITIGSGNSNNTTTTTTPSAATFNAAQVVTKDDPYLGDKSKAKIAIVEFSDFECPFCKNFHSATFEQIISDYVDTDKAIFAYRNYPLSFHEPVASLAANAAECVASQKGNAAFFTFAQNYYNKTQANGQGLPSGTTIEDLAKDAGITDLTEYTKCYTEARFQSDIELDTTEGTAAGVQVTPGFIIGTYKSDGSVDGVLVPGAITFADFQKVIEEQLGR